MKVTSLILLLTSFAFLGCSKPSDDLLEFRLAQYTEAPKWIQTEFNGKTIWLKPTAEMSSVHVKSAKLVWSKTRQEEWDALTLEKQAQIKLELPDFVINTNRRPEIEIRFTPEGTKLMTEISTKFTGKNLALVYRGKVLIAPFLNEPIHIESARITGVFTKSEVQRIISEINKK